jgi:acyl dehydratase
VIFANPAGAPELACDECGCRWFDRMSDSCYECGARVSPAALDEFRRALQVFGTGRPGLERAEPLQCAMAVRYYWEDFKAGWIYESPARALSAKEIVAFAREYDPQLFHVDEVAARTTPFEGLIASGWHTVAVAMRLMCDGYLLDSACLGSPGVDELRWLKPVRPGDSLRLRATMLEQTPSQKLPSRGTVRFRWEVLNQSGEVVCSMVGRQLFRRRNAATAGGEPGA